MMRNPRSPISSPLQPRIRLRTLLVVPFAIQTTAVVGLVAWLSIRSGQQAVEDVARQLSSETAQRIQERLSLYIEVPHLLNQFNANAITTQPLGLEEPAALQQFLWRQIQAYRGINNTYLGTPTGEFIGMEQGLDDRRIRLQLAGESTDGDMWIYDTEGGGQITDRVEVLPDYDPRRRPWYTRAQTAGRPIWSEVYPDFDTGALTITAAYPLYDQTGDLVGVLGSDFIFSFEFNDFLSSLAIGQSGEAVILERTGEIIATSQPMPEPELDPEATDQRQLAVESSDPLMQAIGQHLDQITLGDLDRSPAPDHQLQIDGARYFLRILPLRDERGIDWLIVVAIPDADFLQQLQINNRRTLLLCLAALGIAIELGIITTRLIMRALLKLTEATERIAQGDLNQTVRVQGIVELKRLGDSFTLMSQQLRQAFRALKDSETTNRAIVEAIPDLLIRVNREGIYLDIKGTERFILHQPEAFRLGSRIQDSLPPHQAQQRLDSIHRALETGEIQQYDQHLVIRDDPRDEEVRVMRIQPDEALIIVRDITERKRAEEALRIAEETYHSIFENALEGIFQSNTAGRFTRVNPAMAQMFGYDSPEEMVQQITEIRSQLFVDPHHRDRCVEQLEDQGAVNEFEFQAYRKDGEIIWVQQSTRVVRNDRGEVLYDEGIVVDITDQKRREADLKRQLQELQIEIDQNKRQRDFARITQDRYFQEIQAEVEEIDLDEFWT